MEKNGTKTVLVVGLGRFGSALCERLVALGQRVIGVDRARANVEELSELLDVAAQLDATEEEALAKVGAREADVAVVAIGEHIEASILATTLLRGMGVPLVMARAQNALHARVLAKVGAHRVVFPERDMGFSLADLFVHPWLTQFAQVPGSDFLVGHVSPLDEMCGKTLQELSFRRRYNAIVLMVSRRGSQILPAASTVLEPEDEIFIASRSADLQAWFAEAFLKSQMGEGVGQGERADA